MNTGEADLDALAGRVTTDLLAQSHLVAPHDVAEAVREAAKPLGVLGARIYLADLQQRQLVEMPPGSAVLGIDSTIGGHAYRMARIHRGQEDIDSGGQRLWIPLIDGTERLGVLELTVADASKEMLARYRTIASLVALIVVAKGEYSDAYAQVRRRQDMALQAEMIWGFLAPRTFATERVLVSATLEPAYEVGGDAFDYSLLGDNLHVSVFDAVGHDLAAGLLASVAMASCRSTRRSGGSLADIVTCADQAIASQFGRDRFVTALLGDLDVVTGEFTWIPCGHPPPLLIRDNRVVKELDGRPELPLGLSFLRDLPRRPGFGGQPDRRDGQVRSERLQPRDRLLVYTDGVTEGRDGDGKPFGTERLSDFIIRNSDATTSAPEALRRLTQAITEYQQGRLSDDASIMLVEWMPERTHGDTDALGQ